MQRWANVINAEDKQPYVRIKLRATSSWRSSRSAVTFMFRLPSLSSITNCSPHTAGIFPPLIVIIIWTCVSPWQEFSYRKRDDTSKHHTRAFGRYAATVSSRPWWLSRMRHATLRHCHLWTRIASQRCVRLLRKNHTSKISLVPI